jgi:hypothetical protein
LCLSLVGFFFVRVREPNSLYEFVRPIPEFCVVLCVFVIILGIFCVILGIFCVILGIFCVILGVILCIFCVILCIFCVILCIFCVILCIFSVILRIFCVILGIFYCWINQSITIFSLLDIILKSFSDLLIISLLFCYFKFSIWNVNLVNFCSKSLYLFSNIYFSSILRLISFLYSSSWCSNISFFSFIWLFNYPLSEIQSFYFLS